MPREETLELKEEYEKLLEQEREIQISKRQLLEKMSILGAKCVTYYRLKEAYDTRYKHRFSDEEFHNYVYVELSKMAEMIEDVSIREVPELITQVALSQLRGHYGIIPRKYRTANSVISFTIFRLVERAIFDGQAEYIKKRVEQSGPIPLDTKISSFFLSRRMLEAFSKNGFDYMTREYTLGEFMDFYSHIGVNARRVGPAINSDVYKFLAACGYTPVFSHTYNGTITVSYETPSTKYSGIILGR